MGAVEWLYYLMKVNIWTAHAFWIFMGVCSVNCILNGWEDIKNSELKKRHRIHGAFSFLIGIFALVVSFVFSMGVK